MLAMHVDAPMESIADASSILAGSITAAWLGSRPNHFGREVARGNHGLKAGRRPAMRFESVPDPADQYGCVVDGCRVGDTSTEPV